MKTNYKYIKISTLILFLSLTGLSPAAEQYGGEFRNDNYRNGSNTRIEVSNYYGNYGASISYAARINRFHRTTVSVNYYAPYYYYSGYYNYYTPFWDNWYYFREMAYYDYRFSVGVYYNPWPYYYRTGYYSSYCAVPVYYRSNYKRYWSSPAYYNSYYRGSYSERYSKKAYNSGYYSYKNRNHSISDKGNHTYSKGVSKKYPSNSMVNRNSGRSQSKPVAVSNKRRSQNHFVSNSGNRDNRSQVKSVSKNNGAKTLSSSARRSAGSLNKNTYRSQTSKYTTPVSKSYNSRRSVSNASSRVGRVTSPGGTNNTIKAKRVVNSNRKPGTFSGTRSRNVSVQKSANYSNRSNATKQIASSRAGLSSRNSKVYRAVEQKNKAKTRSTSERNPRR